jgi:hypothetical protein
VQIRLRLQGQALSYRSSHDDREINSPISRLQSRVKSPRLGNPNFLEHLLFKRFKPFSTRRDAARFANQNETPAAEKLARYGAAPVEVGWRVLVGGGVTDCVGSGAVAVGFSAPGVCLGPLVGVGAAAEPSGPQTGSPVTASN